MKQLKSHIAPSRFYNLMPVKAQERSKVILLCLLKALFSFAYTMLKLQKSSNVVTTHGAEKIAYINVFLLPITLLLIAGYTALTNRITPGKAFYSIIIFFFIIFSFYAFVLIPYKSWLTPDTQRLEALWINYPTIKSFIQVYKHWIQVYFYCFSDLFAQFFIIIFFWGIANELFSHEQAKRVYHIFIAAGYVGSTIATQVIKVISRSMQREYVGEAQINLNKILILDRTSQSIAYLTLFVIIIVFFIYRWILTQTNLLTEESSKIASEKREKKLTFLQSIKVIFSNPYLIATTIIIISCAVSSKLIDITYYKYIQNLSHSLPTAYITWTANQLFFSNMLCILFGFFFTHWISRNFTWKFNALITPVVMIIMGGLFFILSALNYHYGLDRFTYGLFDLKASILIAWFGFFQAIATVFARYVFFDSNKEVIFINLGPDVRRKGKAAVDVVGSRFGHSLSSYIHVGILSFFLIENQIPPVERVSHILLFVLLLFCIPWILSIRYLAPKIDGPQKPTEKKNQRKSPKKKVSDS